MYMLRVRQREVTKMLNNVQRKRIGYIPVDGGNGNNNSWDWDWKWVVWLVDWIKGTGWLEQGEWCQQLGGILLNGTAEGGPLEEFERQTGRSFPELQAKRQTMVNCWLGWRDNQWYKIWETPELSAAYKAACQAFAAALDAARAEYVGGIPGFLEWMKKNWKTLAITGSILAVGITAAVAVSRRK
ncbi:hypothetical protein ES702_07380 [subsurface metagenome]